MLRWLVLLTLALLPWFAWAHPAVPGPGMAHHDVAGHTGTAVGMPGAPAEPDCPEHGGSATHHGQATQAGSELGECPTCSACQACSSAALLSTLVAPQPARFEAPRPIASSRRFASADHAPGYKPPIS